MNDNTHFDENYYQNNGQQGDRIALKFYFDIFKNYLKEGKVLEYGSGEGYLNKRLATKYEAYAYDISEYARKALKKISPDSHVLASENEFQSESMDGIISLHTLEHVPNPEETINLLYRTLKKDGILFYVVPNIDGWGHKIKKDKWFGYRDETHISMLPTQQWKELTKKAGFDVIKTSSDGFWDVPYVSYLPNVAQKLVFFPSAALQVFVKRIFYPEWFGECLILVARKK